MEIACCLSSRFSLLGGSERARGRALLLAFPRIHSFLFFFFRNVRCVFILVKIKLNLNRSNKVCIKFALCL